MGYIIIGAILLIAVLPFSIRNRTKNKQEQISKKAALYGIDLNFNKNKE